MLKNVAHSVDIDEKDEQLPIVRSMIRLIGEYQAMPKGRVTSTKSKDTSPIGTQFEPTCVYKMLRQCGGDTFQVEGRQEDAEEFMSFLLNGLHEEFLKSSNQEVNENGQNGVENGEEDDEWVVQGPKKKVKTIHHF